MDRVDVIEGTLAKAFGCLAVTLRRGPTSSTRCAPMRRASSFTTVVPPPVCAAATAAIRHLKSSTWERERHQDRAARVKAVLNASACGDAEHDPHRALFVGNAERCKQASDSCSRRTASTSSRSTTRRGARRRAAAHHALAVPRRRADRRPCRSAGRRLGAARLPRGPTAGRGVGEQPRGLR